VDHSAFVSVLQPAGRLQDAVQRLAQRQRPLLLDERRQVAAVHILHHEEVRTARFASIVGDHDVGMRQPGRSFDLTLEPSQSLRRLGHLGREHLQRHQPFHPPVLGLEDQPHPALAELVENDVLPQHQRPALAGVNLLGLVSGELLETDQLLRQLFAILRFLLGGQAVDQCNNLIRGHQTAVGKLMHELVDRDRHDEFPGRKHGRKAGWCPPGYPTPW